MFFKFLQVTTKNHNNVHLLYWDLLAQAVHSHEMGGGTDGGFYSN